MSSTPSPAWTRSPPDHLTDDEALIVQVDLTAGAGDLRAFERLLDDAERARLARLRTEALRRRFAVARARLRECLARFEGCAAEELAFVYGPHGKPALAADQATWHFNVAHSGETALIAISRHPIGVDIETRRVRDRLLSIAARYFAPRECAWIEAHPESERHAAFYTLWTRKEAVLKADGIGITVDLSGIEVIPGEPVRGPDVSRRLQSIAWRLLDLPALDDAASALAVAPEVRRLVCVQSAGAPSG